MLPPQHIPLQAVEELINGAGMAMYIWQTGMQVILPAHPISQVPTDMLPGALRNTPRSAHQMVHGGDQT